MGINRKRETSLIWIFARSKFQLDEDQAAIIEFIRN